MPRTIARGTGRAALLAAAEAELAERRGALDVASVAARAEVSVGLVYRHFASKAGLLSAVVDAFYDRLDAAVLSGDPAPGESWAAREHRRTRRVVAFHYADPLAPVVLALLERDPEAAAAESRRLRAHVAEGTRNIRAGQRAGELDDTVDPGIAAALVLGGVRTALIEVLGRDRRPPPEAVADQLWRLVAAAVRVKETPP